MNKLSKTITFVKLKTSIINNETIKINNMENFKLIEKNQSNLKDLKTVNKNNKKKVI